MALADDQRLRVRPDVLSRQLEDETVLLDLASGTYFGLNEVGASIWAMLREEASVAEMREKILGSFEGVSADTVAKDLDHLLTDLEGRGLIEVVG
jgi:hypothetical protein